jgi:hypothetical protein
MATTRVDIAIETSAERVWSVVRDFERGPLIMAPRYVIGCQAHLDMRIVTFANGTIARERLIAVDEQHRRIVFSIIGDTIRPEHDNAVMQVIPGADSACTLVWMHDVLPDDLAPTLHAAMVDATPTIQTALSAGGNTGDDTLESHHP